MPELADIINPAELEIALGLLGTTASIATAASVTTVASNLATHAAEASHTNSRAPNGAAGGDLSGTYPNPAVARITSAGTPLTVGTVADLEVLRRNGTSIEGRAIADLREELWPKQTYYTPLKFQDSLAAQTVVVSQRAYAAYIGKFPAGFTADYVLTKLVTIAVGSGQSEFAIASSAAGPVLSSVAGGNALTILAAGTTETMTASPAPKRNSTPLGVVLDAATHLWVIMRSEFATTQPATGLAQHDQLVFAGQIKSAQPALTTLVGSTISTWTIAQNFPTLWLQP